MASRHAVRGAVLSTVAAAVLVSPVLSAPAHAAATLLVPQNYPTIQAAVDAAAAGDTVLVSPGTYPERLLIAKAVTVQSTDGPAGTVVDGNGGITVSIVAPQDEPATLRGFTVTGGTDGGVQVTGGPALVERNVVSGNTGCAGAGIRASFSAATVRANVVSGNQPNCSGGPGGGGILIIGAGTVTAADNVVTGNVASSDGGGIALFAAGTPTLSGNVIRDNSTDLGDGGGISLVNSSDALITNNVVVGNTARDGGGGIAWLVPSGQPGPNVVNNTVADNTAARGSAVFADGFDAGTRLTGNVLTGAGAQAVVECGNFDTSTPRIAYNDVFHTEGGPAYGGICTDRTGTDGNISADPQFVDAAAGNVHLRPGSPAIDASAGDGAPAQDIDGDPRPLDGNGDGVPVVDMGADEVRPGDTTPPTITCVALPPTLRPADRRLRPVIVVLSARDDSGTVTVTLTSVTSNQADSGLDPRDVPNDIQGWAVGRDDRFGLLRAERVGAARVYTLTYRAADAAGNTATCRTTVTVPR